jgi:hypothetical protein
LLSGRSIPPPYPGFKHGPPCPRRQPFQRDRPQQRIALGIEPRRPDRDRGHPRRDQQNSPPTPDFPGRPTRKANSPELS